MRSQAPTTYVVLRRGNNNGYMRKPNQLYSTGRSADVLRHEFRSVHKTAFQVGKERHKNLNILGAAKG